MSAANAEAEPRRLEPSRADALGRFLARESLPIIVCCVLVGLIAVLSARLLSTDGWLALVGGRAIVRSGLPHHETLTVLALGRDWVDQQWLGQLAFYGLERLGGLKLILVVNLFLVGGAFAAAVVYARLRGGRATTVSVVALLALLPFLVTAMNVRTQSFAYLPFVALVAVLARPGPVSPRSALLILATLAVWSNVHGSVLLAAALVVLRGALLLWESRRERVVDRVGAALLVGPLLAVFASPYGYHLSSYYKATAFNPAFGKYLSYWSPTTFSPISLPLLLLLFALIWLLGRVGSSYTRYERVLIVVCVVVGLLAVRNWTFASLLAIMFAPAGLDAALRTRPARETPRLGSAIALVVVAATAIGVVAAFARPDAKLSRGYPPSAVDAVRAVPRDGKEQVYASLKFADWLMWSDAGLEGKVIFDARYELLKTAEVRRFTLFSLGTGVDAPLGRPTVYVLDPLTDEHAIAALRPHVSVMYDTPDVFVARPRTP